MESMTRTAQRKKMTKGGGVPSSKGGYDGVFSAPAAAQRFKAPAAVEDYTEIFGGGSRGSSIPVLDLSGLDETTENFRSSKLDYENIFGGFVEDLAVPYEELLSQGSVDSKCSNEKASDHSEKELPLQGADTCNLSRNSEEPPPEVSDSSLDAMKQFNMSYLKTRQGNKNQPNGTTHVAKLHAVPGFTYFVNEPPSKQKTESAMPIPPINSEVHRTWSFSGNIPDENNRKTEMRLPSKPTAERVSGAKGGSQSKDSHLKSQSFKTAPSSNYPLGSFGISGHPERSKSLNISSKANPFEKSTGNGTDGSSDEELDIDSDAAACAAALKRVLEKAQESIRMAKEIRERGEKDGIRRFSNVSSEYISKSKDKKKHRVDQEANSSKKQNVKDRHERLVSELHESDERNRRLGSRTIGVSTAFECSQEPFTSTEAAKGKSPLDIAEVDGKSKQISDLGDTEKSVAATLASDLVDIGKSTTPLSMRKQESVASLSMEKQESVDGETTLAETSEQIENNVEIEISIDKDFGMGNAENNIHVDEQTQVSEVTANGSDSAPVNHEFRTSVCLETTEKDARSEDMNYILDELRHCEIKLPECLDSSEGKKLEPSGIEDQHMLNESENLAKEGEQNLANCEGYQQVRLELQFVYSQGEKENGLYSCNEGSMLHQEACGFVEIDDASEVCGSGSPERTHKGSQEGEACGTSNGVDSCNEGGTVQQEAYAFVASDDAPEVCGSRSWERTHKDNQEGEACGTSNAIDEIGVNDAELIYEYKGEEAPHLPYEDLKKKVVEDLDPTEKKLINVPHEEKSTKVLKEEHREEKDQKRSEETYNQLKVDWNTFGEEFDWREVEKRIKKGCIIEDTEIFQSEKYKIYGNQEAIKMIQEKEETTFVHVENHNYASEQIDLLHKAAHENNFDRDAYVSLHDVQEGHSTSVIDDHEASNSTTGTSEEFYNCEWEGNSEEETLKGCELEKTKLDEKSDFVQCPPKNCVSSSESPFASMAVDSDENGTNADHDGLIREDNLPRENVLETAYCIQNCEKDNDIRFKLQDVSENEIETNFSFCADIRGTVTDENVKGPEPFVNPESGGDFLYRFRENTEHVHKEFSFDKEDENVDSKVVYNVENKEKETDETKSSAVTHQSTKSSAVTHQSTVTQESVEELTTGQNIQFVRIKPQKVVLPEDNEARESSQKDLKEKEHSRKIESMKRERERDKDRIAVDRAIREARERAFADARERAERAAVARAGAEVRQRMMAEAQGKLEKSTAGTKLPDKASIEAKQRAERSAVERATAEARERALEKALLQKSTAQERVQTDRLSGTSKDGALKHSFSSSDLESFDGNNSESTQRRKARLERHERIMERAAKALADKNMRDLHAQKEQAERNRLAESLDADVKRWANGKEGNLRALLSTLQYILGPDSGWQPISLTEIITTVAVKKAYRKATLIVHPDKLQQRGASIHQKYICEKVFYLLKAAWNKFNSEER